jgi:hypothetical protein
VESLLDEAEVSSLQTKYQFERPITFYPTVWSSSNFYRSFQMKLSLELMLNRYSVRRRSRHSRPEYRFERVITFDPTVGSPSKFYRSLQTLFSLE